MTPPTGTEGASHLDIVRAIGRLEGATEQNFSSLFHQQRATDEKVDQLGERIAKLEVRRVRLEPKKRVTWKTGGAIAVAIVTLLGGLASAYHEGVAILVAIHHALLDGGPK